jgi:transposase-like protein
MPIDIGLKQIECPECGGTAKRVRKKIFGKKTPGAKFKCKQCGHELYIQF